MHASGQADRGSMQERDYESCCQDKSGKKSVEPMIRRAVLAASREERMSQRERERRRQRGISGGPSNHGVLPCDDDEVTKAKAIGGGSREPRSLS